MEAVEVLAVLAVLEAAGIRTGMTGGWRVARTEKELRAVSARTEKELRAVSR